MCLNVLIDLPALWHMIRQNAVLQGNLRQNAVGHGTFSQPDHCPGYVRHDAGLAGAGRVATFTAFGELDIHVALFGHGDIGNEATDTHRSAGDDRAAFVQHHA